MKKIIIVSMLLLVFLTGCSKEKEDIEKDETVSLMKFDEYINIVVDKIESIDLIKYTEGGRDDNKITDVDQIQKIYNNLSNLKVGKETNRACEDNTKIYVFNMSDGNNYSIEIECDWLIIGNKRYEIE